MTGVAIPVFPTSSLPETLRFYRVLGFEVTHEQTRPNLYAATRRGGLDLHFMGIPSLDPARAYTTCLVIVPEVEQLHRTFAEALRAAYGKLPIAGVPRISRMRPGQSRFTIVDVAGNSLIFIRRDDRAAAKVLDTALRRPARGAPLERARVLAARIELAVALDEPDRATAARAELDALPLSDAERAELARAAP